MVRSGQYTLEEYCWGKDLDQRLSLSCPCETKTDALEDVTTQW